MNTPFTHINRRRVKLKRPSEESIRVMIDPIVLLEENRQLRVDLDTARAELYALRGEKVRQAANPDLLKPSEVMARLGYRDRKAFWRMAKAKGLPMVHVNARVIRFDPQDFDRWQARRAGKAA